MVNDDAGLGTLFAGIGGVLLMLYLIISNIAGKIENTSQAYIDNAVVEFVDNARSTGQITDTAYEQLCRKIDNVISMAHVEIIHQSQYISLDDNGNCYYSYFSNPKDDILDTIYTVSGENMAYKMKKGDFLQVIVYNGEPTFATKIYRLLMPLYNESGVSIYTSYSGYVGNRPE